MEPNSTILDILTRADTDLRRCIEQLAAEGKYADVELAARVAKAINRISAELGRDSPSFGHPESADVSSVAPAAAPEPNTQRRRSPRDYPQFKRDGDRLVKVAWSKHERKEYEHRAPRAVIDSLLETIKRKKGDGRVFQASDLFPIKDLSSRQEIPSYQSYLALAWLRHEGLATKKGRDRYVLKAAATPERLAQLWEALPTEG